MAVIRLKNIGKAEIASGGFWKKHDIVDIEFFANDGKIHIGKFASKDLRNALKAPRGEEVKVTEVYPLDRPV